VCDRRIDLDVGRALGHQQPCHPASVDRLHLDGGLVGLDLANDVAGFDLLAFLDPPLASLPLSMVGERVGITIWMGIPRLSS
jgi:hypothetical protein